MSTTTEPINLLLSRDELLVVLRSLGVETIPGIDSDPLGNLTAEGMEVAATVAGRGLWARDLARMQGDGRLVLHNLLLTAVGICAYATQTVFVYHWPEDGAVARRGFGHIRGDDFVVHTRPADVLHLFTMLPAREQMVEQVLRLCDYEEREQPEGALTLAAADLGRVRQWARQGAGETAVSFLTDQGADGETAVSFVNTLSHSPHISVWQLLRRQADQGVAKYDCTLIQNKRHSWFVAPGAEDAGVLRVETAVKANLVNLLNDWL